MPQNRTENYVIALVYRSKSMWYKAQKVQKYALNSQLTSDALNFVVNTVVTQYYVYYEI